MWCRAAHATAFSCDEAGLDAALAAGGGPHTFNCAGPATITTTATKTVAASVILDGEGDLTISGNNTHGVFFVDTGVTFEVRNLTIADGAAAYGGGIYNLGDTTVADGTISANSAAVNGGGIYSSGSITITGSTVNGNSAENGGGLFGFGGLVGLSNSTVSGNAATTNGAGLMMEYDAHLTLTVTTVAENVADGRGGGVYIGAAAGTVFSSSAIGGNTALGASGDDCNAVMRVASGGFNVIGDASDCYFEIDPSDVTGTSASPVDLLLGPLADNGGPTLTHALNPASPAFDLDRSGSCAVAQDQRDIGRPIGLGCDAGAFELEGVPSHHFNVDPNEDRIWGHQWFPGQVDVYVDALLEGTTDVDGSGDFNLDLQGTYDLTVGQEIEVVHTTIPSQHKAHTVLGLTVTGNETTDIVGGATNADALDVDVWVSGGPSSSVTPETGGSWEIDFWATHGYDIVMGDNGGASQCDQDAGDEYDCTLVGWAIPSPDHHFGVDPQHDFVAGWNWPAGGSLTVQVDNDLIPDNGSALKEWNNIPVDGNGNFWLNQDEGDVFDITTGHVIRVTDENTTDGVGSKDTTVLALTVDEPVNPGDIGISGTGDPANGDVTADIHGDPGEHLTVPITGSTWTATFATTPLTYFLNGSVHQAEPAPDDGDRTEIWWNTPNPQFVTDYNADTVRSSGDPWIADTVVTVNAYDDDTKSTLLGTASTTADSNGEWSIDLTTESIDVNPGDYIVVTQGSILKDHVIIDLTIGVTQDTGNVNGTTDLYSVADYHDVSVWIDNGPSDNVTPDVGTGIWGVDFNTAQHGDYIITAGDSGGASQLDGDGDQTEVTWSIPESPWFRVTPDAGSIYDPGDRIYGWAFAPNTQITITITGAPMVYTPTTNGDGYFEYDVWNDPQPGFKHDLSAGDLVTVFDGTTTKSHTVIDLAVAGTVDTGLVGGGSNVYGDVGYNHDVDVWRHSGPSTSVTPDAGDGSFGVDFDTPEFGNVVLQQGDGGGASQSDDDGDRTDAYWRIPQPLFNINAANDSMWGHEWSPGTLTITVDRGSTSESWSAPVSTGGDGQNPGDFGLDLTQADPVVGCPGGRRDHGEPTIRLPS